MYNKFSVLPWVFVLFHLISLNAFSAPCTPKTSVSALIKQFESDIKPVTEKLIRPSHAEFVRAVNAIDCKDVSGRDLTYDRVLQEMRNMFEVQERNTAPFKDDSGNDTDELLSIFIYTHDCYNQINDFTEAGRSKEIQAYIDMTKIALNRLPPYRGLVFRASNLGGMATDHQKGKFIRYRNFISTSKSKQLQGKDYHLMIHSETGRYVAPYSAHFDEDEVLFPPGATFQIQERIKPAKLPAYRQTASAKMMQNKWNPNPNDPYIQGVIVLKEVPEYQGKALLVPSVRGP